MVNVKTGMLDVKTRYESVSQNNSTKSILIQVQKGLKIAHPAPGKIAVKSGMLAVKAGKIAVKSGMLAVKAGKIAVNTLAIP